MIHGWEEHINTGWVMDTIRNLTYYRGGCVLFMDYSRYSRAPYTSLATHFFPLSMVLKKKVQQVSDDYNNVFMYGFSFGARLAFEAGRRLGYQQLERIDACDPAGPAFDSNGRHVDPKYAAKSVNCINTSIRYGTNFYDCHINFRMGVCGYNQLGASRKPCGSHGLCVNFNFTVINLLIIFMNFSHIIITLLLNTNSFLTTSITVHHRV